MTVTISELALQLIVLDHEKEQNTNTLNRLRNNVAQLRADIQELLARINNLEQRQLKIDRYLRQARKAPQEPRAA